MQYKIFTLLLLWSTLSIAQTELSLSDAIQLGLKNNFQIQIADKQIDIAKRNNTLKATSKYPRIDLNVSSTNNFLHINDPTSFLDGASLFSFRATPSVDLQWTLFDGHQARITKQQLEQLEFQSLGNKEIIVENTLQAIILAYYRAVIEQEKITVLEEVKKLSRDRYDYEQVRRDIGTGGTFNILQTENAYLSDSLNVVLQETLARQMMRNLNLAMGEDNTEKTYTLTDKLEYNPATYDATQLEQKMFANNSNLKNQILNIQLQKANTEMQRSNRLPRITMQTGVSEALSQNYLGDLSGNQFNFYLNFSLTYNLYDAGQTKRAIQNAVVNEKISELNVQDQKRTLKGQLYQNIATYNDQLQLIALNDALIQNAEKNLAVAETRYKTGVINSFDYRNIQVAFIRASLSKLETIFNLKTTETDLMRLTGGIIDMK